MADTSSYKLLLFSAHQQRTANPCLQDADEKHKLLEVASLLVKRCGDVRPMQSGEAICFNGVSRGFPAETDSKCDHLYFLTNLFR